jgi:hypothetical protein
MAQTIQRVNPTLFAKELRLREVTIEDVARSAQVGVRTVYRSKSEGVTPRTIDRMSIPIPSIRKMLREDA